MGAIHANEFTECLYKEIGLLKYLRDNSLEYSDDKTERQYTIFSRCSNPIVNFRARPLPGCCGVLVVYYLRPTQTKNSLKVFRATLSLIVKAAGKAKFGLVILSQTINSPIYDILKNAHLTTQFTNWKTKNQVGIFTIKTTYKEKKIARKVFDGE